MEESTVWMMFAALAMTGLSFTLVLISKIASERLLKEQQKRNLMLLEHQKEMLRHSLMVQEKERERISAELHDDLAAKICVVRLMAAVDQNGEIKKHLDDILDTTRQLSRDLYPRLLERLGLEAALKDFLAPLASQMGVDFTFTAIDSAPAEKKRDVHLFRIVQETVQNTLKHAHASNISIAVRRTDAYTALCIKDNGRGFDLHDIQKNGGLKSLASRVQLLNGKYKVSTKPQGGTKCVVVVWEIV